MNRFAYARATTVPEAAAAATDPGTSILAGGTELLNWLRLGIATPDRMIDISHIAGLDRIEPLPNGGLRIGAMVRLNDLARHEVVSRDWPALSQATLKAASAQLRNLATLGGNFLQKTRCAYFRDHEPTACNKRIPGSGCAARNGANDRHAIFGWSEACVAVHPADPPVALAALDAVLLIEGGGGSRRVPVREFHTLPDDRPEVETVLRAGELITAIELPVPARRSAYIKVRERESYEYATVSAAVALDLDGDVIRTARIALGSVAHRPWRLEVAEKALIGLTLGLDKVDAAVGDAFETARPLSHNAYKIPLARNAALRALTLAARMPA